MVYNKPGSGRGGIVPAALLALLAAAPVQAIPPPSFGFPDSANHTELGVSYVFNGNTTNVQEAMLLGGNITQSQPQLSVNPALYQSVATYTGNYLVIMVDPDASTPENPTRRFILHWLAANVTQSSSPTNNGTTTTSPSSRALSPPSTAGGGGATDLVSYRPPMPPETSSAHRYILYAFQQPANFSVPAAFAARLTPGGGAEPNRTNFELEDFMSAARLGRPAAAEYFYVSRQAQVPGTFVALAGGQYPGGNGGAIFEGSTTNGTTGSGSESGSGDTGTGTGTGAGTGTATSAGTRSGRWQLSPVLEGMLKTAIWGLAALL